MMRMFFLAGAGAFVGFGVLAVLFMFAAPSSGPDRMLWFVFSVMGAVPVAVLGAIFGAVATVKEDLFESAR